MRKLTLSMDDKVIEQAKEIAARNNTSVSTMVSGFIRAITTQQKKRVKLGHLTRQMSGIVKLDEDQDYKELISETLSEKYKT